MSHKDLKHIKVCHFASVHTTIDTRVFHRECVSLAKKYDVTLIAIGRDSDVVKGVNVIAVPKPKSRWRRLLFTTWNVFFKACSVNADVYHIHDAELIPFAVILSLCGKKVIYDIHENTYEDIIHKPWIPMWLRKLSGSAYRSLEWLASVFMHTVLVIAKPEFAKRFLWRKHHIIQNFADVNDLKSYRVKRSEIKENNLFYIGTIFDYFYHMEPVMEALAMLKSKGLLINFHCVGYYGQYLNNTLSKLPAYQQVKDQLHFYGHLSTHEGFKISRQCRAGLCLKNQPPETLVSHERKFFEYMAIGLPMVTCDSHIYKEVVDEWKIGVTADLTDAHAIAAAIEKLFTNQDEIDRMQQNCIDAAEQHYNWESQEKILFEMYAAMLS